MTRPVRPPAPIPNPAAQAVGVAVAMLIDRYTVALDVDYLVRNGIAPDLAAQRILAHRRRMTIWGFAAAPSLLYIGLLFGGAVHLVVTGFGAIVLTGALNPLPVAGGVVCAALGLGWAYALMMYAVRSWRTAARGCLREDTASAWLLSRVPTAPSGFGAVRIKGRCLAIVAAGPVAVLAAGAVLAPVLGGLVSAVRRLTAMG